MSTWYVMLRDNINVFATRADSMRDAMAVLCRFEVVHICKAVHAAEAIQKAFDAGRI